VDAELPTPSTPKTPFTAVAVVEVKLMLVSVRMGVEVAVRFVVVVGKLRSETNVLSVRSDINGLAEVGWANVEAEELVVAVVRVEVEIEVRKVSKGEVGRSVGSTAVVGVVAEKRSILSE
jgi:hypothetical protein